VFEELCLTGKAACAQLKQLLQDSRHAPCTVAVGCASCACMRSLAFMRGLGGSAQCCLHAGAVTLSKWHCSMLRCRQAVTAMLACKLAAQPRQFMLWHLMQDMRSHARVVQACINRCAGCKCQGFGMCWSWAALVCFSGAGLGV
jgi:hypothetical protein